MEYLILDSDNNWLATCDKKDIKEVVEYVKEQTDSEEIYIYESKLFKTIKL